ncbi:MAG: extracellular solute-binding protein [Alphaproteobacteria bacterium]|nr:extracellular solute-binding protein [Alphaproteobacteria bacterium]
MSMPKNLCRVMLVVFAAFASPAAHGAELTLYNWADYTPRSVLDDFAAETGHRVKLKTFETAEEMEAALQSGAVFDLTVPTAQPYFGPQIQQGLFQPLDMNLIPRASTLDARLMKGAADADPGNKYGVIYAWGTTGFGIDAAALTKRFPEVQLDSWQLIFDEQSVRRFADCGVSLLDSPSEVVPHVMLALGKDPNNQSLADLEEVFARLQKIRPYVQLNAETYADDLAAGKLCLAFGYSGDLVRAAETAKAKGRALTYILPKEGAMMWFDMLAIPSTAKNYEIAHSFINFMLKPENAAKISNEYLFATAVPASWDLVKPDLRKNPNIFPPADVRQKLFVQKAITPRFQREIERRWEELKKSVTPVP